MKLPEKLTVAVAQTASECQLGSTADKMASYIRKAKDNGCRVVVFAEAMLRSATGNTRNEIDEAVNVIRRSAADNDIYVIFGLYYKYSEDRLLHNQALVVGPDGEIRHTYDKLWSHYGNTKVPGIFEIDGIPCCAALCADRWLRGVEELPAFQGAKILFELSNNFSDEWIPDLGWYWYVPRAVRNSAYVILANSPWSRPAEEFTGYGPGHGHSAIIGPDGNPLTAAGSEGDRLLVAELDLCKATRKEAISRHTHPAMKEFWDTGLSIMNGERIEPPYYELSAVPEANIKIAAAQMVCSQDIKNNVASMKRMIKEAGAKGADIIVFPELAVTGAHTAAIANAHEEQLDWALEEIRNASCKEKLYTVFGMPQLNDGKRWNCAYVVASDGEVLTCHAELNPDRPELFQQGLSTRTLWFEIKGIPSVVTLGREALWNEIAELAAVRGARIHLHLSCNHNGSESGVRFKKQLFINLASFRTFTAAVNAASPGSLCGGKSAIYTDFYRAGRRNMPAGYIGWTPYSAQRLAEAGSGEEIIYAAQAIKGTNPLLNDVLRFNTQMEAWYKTGSRIICMDVNDNGGLPR